MKWSQKEIRVMIEQIFLFCGFVFQLAVYVNAQHGVCMLLLRMCFVCILW